MDPEDGPALPVAADRLRNGNILQSHQADTRLDESLPVLTYKPGKLEIATPEEEQDGYEFYFTIEGDLCP